MASVYISPSTQEKNIGAGDYGTEEKRMNQVANYVVAELRRFGVTVYRNNPEMTLLQIVKDSNLKKPDLHFAIHSNAGGARGGEVYCHRFGGVGEKLARNVYRYLELLTPVADRGVKEGYNFYGPGKHMYELAETNAPAALVEIDFHDSPKAADWIMEHVEAIGIALARGVLETLEIGWHPVDPVAEAIDKLSATGDIRTPEYWLVNARPGKTVDGEFVGVLLERIAKKL